ncbi:MAG: hypothetical protein J1D85_08315 [Bacteroidales bacterium]|nr:hypothetical protein [Bacteroidales bacterium]
MTIEEVKSLTDQHFEGFMTTMGGDVLFGVPIPGHPELEYINTHFGVELLTGLGPEFDYAPWEEAWAEYVEQQHWGEGTEKEQAKYSQEKSRRTWVRAEQAGAIIDMPQELCLITVKEYRDSLRPTDNDTAYIRPIIPEKADLLRRSSETGDVISDGTAPMESIDFNLTPYCDMEPKTISNLDLPTLRALYSVILQDVQNMAIDLDALAKKAKDPQYLGHSVKIYLSNFLQMLGYNKHLSKDSADYAVRKIMSYQNIIGVMEEHVGDRTYRSLYPVMVFHGYDDKDGTLTFASPYINVLIINILKKSVRMDKKGNPKLSNTGKPLMLPSHSYLVKSSIVKEKNRRAVEIVCIVVETIEMAGRNVPRIRAQAIVDRCPDLKNALDAATPSNRALILKRAFSKAWELLRTQTWLEKTYRNIRFPDDIPRYSDLNKRVFEFPHEGKISRNRNSQNNP